MPDKGMEFASDVEHIVGHMANGAITRPQALIAAGSRAYGSPKMPGYAGHMGNVG